MKGESTLTEALLAELTGIRPERPAPPPFRLFVTLEVTPAETTGEAFRTATTAAVEAFRAGGCGARLWRVTSNETDPLARRVG